MSTKIYNGFRVNAGSALANLNLLSEVKPGVQALVDRKMLAVLTEQIVFEVDRFSLLRHQVLAGEIAELPADWADKRKEYVGRYVRRKLFEEQTECRRGLQRSPLIDCDVELFLRADPDTGMLLGYLQEERVGAHELLIRTPGIEDFGYWNNTDKPEAVSDEEWEARSRLWDKVLDNPVACLSLKFEPDPLSMPAPASQLDFPSRASRAERCARHKLESDAVAAYPKEIAGGGMVSSYFTWASRTMREVRQSIQDGPLKEELHKLTSLYLEVLPPDLQVCLKQTFEEIPIHFPSPRGASAT